MNLDDKDMAAINTPRDERIRYSLGEILDGQKWFEELLWKLGFIMWRITNADASQTALLVSAKGMYFIFFLALTEAFLSGCGVGAVLVKYRLIDW